MTFLPLNEKLWNAFLDSASVTKKMSILNLSLKFGKISFLVKYTNLP